MHKHSPRTGRIRAFMGLDKCGYPTRLAPIYHIRGETVRTKTAVRPQPFHFHFCGNHKQPAQRLWRSMCFNFQKNADLPLPPSARVTRGRGECVILIYLRVRSHRQPPHRPTCLFSGRRKALPRTATGVKVKHPPETPSLVRTQRNTHTTRAPWSGTPRTVRGCRGAYHNPSVPPPTRTNTRKHTITRTNTRKHTTNTTETTAETYSTAPGEGGWLSSRTNITS